MSKTYYFTGEGVLHHKGKDTAHGKALPADLPQETIDAMLKKGTASTTPPAQRGSAEAGELGRLTDKVQTLTVELDSARQATLSLSVELGQAKDTITTMEQAADAGRARIAQLEQTSLEREELLAVVTGERDAARDTVASLEKTVAGLTTQLTAPSETGKAKK